MEQLTIDLLRWLHILSGSLALLAGPIAMFNQDGGKTHRLSGKIYVWSMYVIFITSTILSIYLYPSSYYTRDKKPRESTGRF
jgi:uncharacterized membrane protein